MSVHQFETKTIDGKSVSLSDYAGKTLLIVNVASKCGLTPHYEGLQKLHDELAERGFAVLGFPCNQFGGQEPGTEAEIKEFCTSRYDVTFPMFSKLDVNGPNRAPLYAWLTEQQSKPDAAGDIKWNFAKFVVDGNGEVVARFDPSVAPDDAKLRSAIETSLG